MKYNGLTSVGSIYQAKCAANNIPVKFVKVKVGNGLLEETENPLNFTDIKSLKKEVGISEITQINEAVRLTVPLDNDGVTEGYYPREFGIYAEDDGVEVLYWYINDGQEASYLPPQSSAPVKIKNHFNIIATSLESLIVNWDGKEFWVDKETLNIGLEGVSDLIKGNTGITTIKYIQNQGSKTSGEIYWDKDVNPIVPYYCLTDTESNVVTSDFVMVSNKALIEKNQKDENISLLKSNIKGTGTTYIPEFPNFRYGFITWSISTSPSSITHDHYTAFFDTRLGYVWNTQQHILGAIRVGVSGNSLSITGAGGQYVTIISVYGIGLK